MAKGESPLKQFEIQPIVDITFLGFDISFTNSALWMTITTAFILIFFTVPFLKAKKTNSVSDLYPTRMQVAAELGFNFINSLLADTVGKEGKKYFPLVFTLFMFILFGNLFGMIPYSFTFTSHIIVTLALAMGVFIFVTVLGFVKHGVKFFSFFVIPGLPVYMLPLLILKQFEIQPIVDITFLGFDISFTNSALWMTITTAFILIFFTVPFLKAKKTNSVSDLYPTRMQVAAELGFNFINSLLADTVGKEGKKYFPLVFTLFMFILFGNLFGMIPYSFTFTSHIIVTLALAMGVFIFVTVLGFVKHGVKFFSFFVIPGLPVYMLPLLIPIEIISYLSRPISLSVRLFANMLAGHTLLKVFAGFVSALGFFGILPLVFIIALTGLEILIAFLQAYVFAILTCLYINDALHLH